MPAKGKVNIMWQIVFVLFIPIADIWAFYRIKKLQKSIIYLVLPSIGLLGLIMVPVMFMAVEAENNPEKREEISEDIMANVIIIIIASIGSVALQIWAIYLIFKWSEEWNKQFT